MAKMASPRTVTTTTTRAKGKANRTLDKAKEKEKEIRRYALLSLLDIMPRTVGMLCVRPKLDRLLELQKSRTRRAATGTAIWSAVDTAQSCAHCR